MNPHTSKRLTLDRHFPDCWCLHLEEEHVVRWDENRGEYEGLELGVCYPTVSCLACLEAQLGASRLAARHNLAMAKALLATKPQAAPLVEMMELTETVLQRRDEGAPQSEIDDLMGRQKKLIEEVESLITFSQLQIKGEA